MHLSIIQFSLVLSLVLATSKGARLSSKEHKEKRSDHEESEKFSLAALGKPLADLIVSEYNRVTSTNDKLYIKSHAPFIKCREDYVTSCKMVVTLVETDCGRSEPRTSHCQPDVETMDFITCNTNVDFIEAEVTSPLRCSRSEDHKSLMEELALLAQAHEAFNAEDNDEENRMKVSKKQWKIDDGNPFPI